MELIKSIADFVTTYVFVALIDFQDCTQGTQSHSRPLRMGWERVLVLKRSKTDYQIEVTVKKKFVMGRKFLLCLLFFHNGLVFFMG